MRDVIKSLEAREEEIDKAERSLDLRQQAAAELEEKNRIAELNVKVRFIWLGWNESLGEGYLLSAQLHVAGAHVISDTAWLVG